MNENRIEGRNAVIEAFRSGRTIDRLYMLHGKVLTRQKGAGADFCLAGRGGIR